MQGAKMRMLRWMSEHTKCDEIRNDIIKEKVGVVSVADKTKK